MTDAAPAADSTTPAAAASESGAASPGQARLLWIATFVMAFCSVSYELMLATELSHVLSEGIFAYPASLSVFILSMGLGSWVWFRRGGRRRLGLELTESWLIPVETLLAVLGFLCVLAVDHRLWRPDVFLTSPVAVSLTLSALIGFLSGQELPIVFRIAERLGMTGRQVRYLILFDYLASLVASLAFLTLLFPRIGLTKTSFVVSALNVVALGLLVVWLRVGSDRARSFGRLALAVLVGGFVAVAFRAEDLVRASLHRAGAYPTDVMLAKEHTRYQRILLFAGRLDGRPLTEDPERILRHPEEYHVYGYLNWAIQFDNVVGLPQDSYHRDLMDSFVTLQPNVKKALILGGGDGLPARQLLQYDQVEDITMVDLDPDWIRFTQTNPYMRLVSNDSLNHPRVDLEFGDAFKWVMRTDETFDAIFIDFPEDTNIAAVRTISLQFLNDLRRILNPGGVIVIQDDDPVSLRAGDSAYKTAEAVGLYPLYGLNYGERQGLVTIQLACFKEPETRDQYLADYHEHYLADERRADEFAFYGHVRYVSPDQLDDEARRISFYDPVVLRWDWSDWL